MTAGRRWGIPRGLYGLGKTARRMAGVWRGRGGSEDPALCMLVMRVFPQPLKPQHLCMRTESQITDPTKRVRLEFKPRLCPPVAECLHQGLSGKYYLPCGRAVPRTVGRFCSLDTCNGSQYDKSKPPPDIAKCTPEEALCPYIASILCKHRP